MNDEDSIGTKRLVAALLTLADTIAIASQDDDDVTSWESTIKDQYYKILYELMEDDT